MNLRKIVVILGCFGLLACSSSSPSSSADSSGASTVTATTTSVSKSSMSHTDATVMVSSSSSAFDADLHNILNLNSFWGGLGFGQWLFPGLGMGLGFGFGLESLMWSPNGGCVSVNQVSNTSADRDTLYTFSCTNLTGTYEVKSTHDDTSGNSFEIIDDLSFSSQSGFSSSADDTYSVSKSTAGVVTVSKQIDDTLANGTDTYVNQGNYTYVYTPSDISNPGVGGAIQINGTFDQTKDGTDQGTIAVSSTDLERSSCGLDSGSIQYQNSTDDYVLTITGCGQESLTDNGAAITLSGIPLKF